MSQEINIPGFELLDKIGEGARGTVYRAHQLSLDRLVAIKILGSALATDAEYTANFVQEARAVAKLSHPNIVQAIEAGNHEGVWFFVMELVEGGSLLGRLEQSGLMPEREAIEVAMQVAQALDYAWSQAGLIHRDIKPANILVTPHGLAKLADLGLAMKRGSQKESRDYIEGTPQYCAPEQCRGEPNLDTRTDLYALGATLYHLVCGRPPFDGSDPAKVMTLQITHPVEPPRLLNVDISPEFEALILKLLAKDPADRFQSPAELMEKIQQMRAPQPVAQPEPEPAAKPLVPVAVVTLAPRRTWPRLKRAAMIGGGVLALAAAAVVFFPELGHAQWGSAPKVQAAIQRMAGAVAHWTQTAPSPGKIAGGTSPVVKSSPAASTQAASAGLSRETMFQRLVKAFPRIRSAPPSATAATPQAAEPSMLPRLLAWLTTKRRGTSEPLVVTQSIPVPAPTPVAVVPAPPVAQRAPPSAAPVAPQPTPAPPAPAPAKPVQVASVAPPPPAPQPAAPAKAVPPVPAPVAPAPAPPAVQHPATNVVVASAKARDEKPASTGKLGVAALAKQSHVTPAVNVTPPSMPISMMVQRFFRRKQTAVDAAPIPQYGDGRNYYLETISLRITLQNLSAQTLTNVTVKWVVAKRPVTKDLLAKNVYIGAEEKLVFNPIERKVIDTTPIEVGGVMSWFVGRAYGEMIRGHGVQVLIGTNCVLEEHTPANIKISYKRFQPAPKPEQ